jgi:5-methylcytosine-specific restriction endonuclease McrBC regulatory subunit McrC
MKFSFVDSKPDQKCKGDSKRIPRLLCAIDKLNEAIVGGTVKLLPLSQRRRAASVELEAVITYGVTGFTADRNRDVVTDARFTVSHYIGSYSITAAGGSITVEITPRWGAAILGYLLQYTTGIFLPPNAASGMDANPDSAEWLLVFLWKSLFSQALRRYHTPKEYRTIRTNDRFFKGRLDVQRQIRENISDQSKFCCVHAPLTMNTTINQTIRYVVRTLSRNGRFPVLMSDMAAYDERLASFGVQAIEVTPAQIDAIRYTKMSIGYSELMQVSKAVIRRFGAGASEALRSGTSFFIDIAEIWENYLQAILNRHLPDYHVFSPNDLGGQWLIAGSKRQIRPDILIDKNGEIVAILDAKYKAYTRIGKFEYDGVSREDLYQMTAYLYHYGKTGVPIIGLFVSPRGEADLAVDPMTAEPSHRIGVLNLDISRWDQPDDREERGAFYLVEIREKEMEFARAVRHHLEAVKAD